MAKGAWHFRGLTSLLTLAGFLIMSVTGLVLYIVPEGRVAYWVDWEFLRLSKSNWGDIHILSSILFIVAGAFHIYFNWKPLLNYLRNKATGTIKLKKELAVAAVASVVVWVSAVYRVPPLSYLLVISEEIKTAWVTSKDYEPPFGHAELVTLASLCKKTDIPLDQAQAELEARGLSGVAPDRTLKEIAAANGKSPMEVYRLIQKLESGETVELPAELTPQAVEERFADTGIGNKSMADLATKLELDPEGLVRRLADKKLEIDKDGSLKAEAAKHELQPLELLKAALIDDYVPKR